MKTCTKCHQEKTLTEFYPDQSAHGPKCGYRARCKACQKTQQARYLHSRQGRATIRRYATTAISRARQKRYCLRHPERRQAKNAVYWAIRNGILPHPESIQCLCGSHRAEQYHHHKGYAKQHWLDVMAVCRPYHTQLHYRSPRQPGANQ